MHALRAVAAELRGMARLIDEVMGNPVAQAVVLDLNPLWMMAQRLEQAGLNPEMLRYLDHPLHGEFAAFPWFLSPAATVDAPFDLTRRYSVVDPTRELFDAFPWSNEITAKWEAWGRSFQPLVARIIARPLLTIGEEELRRALVAAARRTPFPTLVETRAEPAPLLGPGDSCKATDKGTIGGFLRDLALPRIFGVTCGHVADSGVIVTSNGQKIGATAYSCNPFGETGVGAPAPAPICRPDVPGVSRLDMALIDLGDAPVRNVVTNAGVQIQRGDLIEMRAGSSLRTYEVGGVVVTSRIKGRCFDRLFEVMPRSSSMLAPLVNAALTAMPAPGDSGAWLRLAGTTTWCGMLIAGEPLMAYALEADDLIKEANRAFGLNLELA